MTAAALPLQAAVYAALAAAVAPTQVYDAVPAGAAFPYVTIGEDAASDWSALAREGEEIEFTVHVWSRYVGSKEAKTLLGQIKAALHGEHLTVSGWRAPFFRMTFSTCFLDPDGKTHHGVIRFRARLSRV